jgi:DNA (cytosine-5)-methyltransferase 1
MQPTYVSFTDLFCGAGGSSEGARQADPRVEIRIAVNHWQLAVDTHAKNFPGTGHDCADISQVHPSRYPSTTFLIASPECTNYTRAKGKRRKDLHEQDLWGNRTLSVEEERSRVRMFDPVYFAEHHKYPFIIIENVVDIKLWSLYDAWLKAWTDLGYEYKECYFNSMFFHPTPQSRDRLYIVLWRKGMRAPDLDYRPRSWCTRCEREVQARQSWKKPTRKHGKFGQRNQYIYCCPSCGGEAHPYYVPAAAAVDWTLPIERIGDRQRPLVERTLRRIRIGLEKFKGHAIAFNIEHTGANGGGNARPLTAPWATQTTQQSHALAVPPFLVGLAHTGGHDNRAYPVTGPAPSQTGTRTYGVVVPPFLVSLNHSDDRLRGLDQPLPTTMPHTAPALCVPPFVVKFRGNEDAAALDRPLGTVTAGGGHHGLLVPPPFISCYNGTDTGHAIDEAAPTVTANDRHALIVPPFVLSYYGGRDAIAPLDQALPTVPTANRHALIQPGEDIDVMDCGFRMFKVPEIRRAMAFPDSYELLGTQDEQIKLLGNAVTPPPMTWMVRQCLAVYGEAGG